MGGKGHPLSATGNCRKEIRSNQDGGYTPSGSTSARLVALDATGWATSGPSVKKKKIFAPNVAKWGTNTGIA